MYEPHTPEAGNAPAKPDGRPTPLGLVPVPPAALPFAIFPTPARPKEPWRRRWLLSAGAAWQWAEVALDRLVSPPLNPLYHTGTIAMFSLAVALVTQTSARSPRPETQPIQRAPQKRSLRNILHAWRTAARIAASEE